ncbi:DUF4397 domain-containing protein, partial [candidate division GN15 bacterium]|nr:DUF4397 domain-containing protein [candidate division GN15 bacterium]
KAAQQIDDAYLYVITTIAPPAPEFALLQVIHNAADTAANMVDIWVNGDLFLDDFQFRTATAFDSVPAGVELNIGVSAADDPTILDSFLVTLDPNGAYVAIANGVLDTTQYQLNPDGRSTSFTLFQIANAQLSSSSDSTVDFAALHGSTDAPTVDIAARGVATLVSGAAYGDIAPYQTVPAASFILDVSDSSSLLASFEADLSTLGGGAAVVFASGFLTPANDQNGAAFGLFAALPNGTVVEFPPYVEPCDPIVLSDSVFAFEAIEGASIPDPPSRMLVITGDDLDDEFSYTVSAPDGATEVLFYNITAGGADTATTVTGMTGDTIMVTVDPSMLAPGQYDFECTVASEDQTVCEPGTETFFVVLDVNEIIIPSDDTVRVATVPAVPGMRVSVPVNFVNSCPLESASVWLKFNQNILHLDSISLTDSRVADELNSFSFDNDSGMIRLTTEADAMLVPIGSGNWANLHLSVACDIPNSFTPIMLDTLFDVEVNPTFVRDCGEGPSAEQPEFVPGGVVVDTSAAYVCGYVVDTAGNAIEGATVQLWGTFPVGMPLDDMLSTSLGSFAFSDFTTIPFSLYAYKEGYYPALAENLNFGDKGIMLVLTPLPELTPTSEQVDYFCGTNTWRGEPLPVGSVVEAWVDDRDLLVGRQVVTEAGVYRFMPVYRANDTFGDDGAVTGDMLSFYVNGMPAVADGDVIYPAEYAQVQVCLSVGDLVTQECTLQEGWNLVSWRVQTETDDIMTILGPYMNNIDVVLGFEQGGLTYDPELPEFSTLFAVDNLSGYWIRVKEGMGFTLEVTGMSVPVSTPIPVTTGWNLVSYLPEMTMAPEDALASLDDILLWAYGFDNGILTYSPTDPQFNTLTEMAGCNGYWVKVSGDGTLMYPGAGSGVAFAGSYILPDAESDSRQAATSSMSSGVTATTQWVNLYSRDLTLDGRPVAAGTPITAHAADGRVVGALTVSRNGEFGFMPVYGKTSAQEAGIEAGETFYLEINGARTSESFVWTGNGARIEITELTSQSAQGNTVPDDYALAQNYPNPFNPTTVISFTMPSAGTARIEVFNILGHKVATPFDGTAAAGTTEVVWDGRSDTGRPVASGVYFYRLTTDTYTDTKKMMLLK